MSLDGIIIRQFKPGDYDEVISLWNRANLPVRPRGRDSLGSICEQVNHANVLLLVAEKGGRVIGTVLGTHDSRKGWVNRLAVDTESRRRNLATRLVSEVEKWFQSNNLDVFACLIEHDNTVSMELFSRLGYQEWDGKYYSRRTRDDS